MNKHSRLPLALALALGSGQVLALGLGQIQVKSALNQPLEAEIELLSAAPAELENLRVQLASSRDAERVGMSAAGPYANLQFSVGRSGGKPVIKVTTPDRVTAPFLSFMLDVNWGKGRLLREYTVLLDPPRTAPAVPRTQAATTPVREPARAPARPVAATPTPKPTPAPAPSRPVTSAAPSAAPATAPAPGISGDQYGPVASGQTLWSIAQQVRTDDSLSHNQIMMALLRANPDAFIGNNINRLKRGAVLRIPSRADIQALAAAEAAAQVRSQMQSWRGEATATTPQPAEPRSAPVERAPAARTSATEPRLRISPPASGETQSAQSGAAEGAAGTAEMRAQLTQTKEELASRSREVSELRERVAELEKIQGDGERLLSMKDSELAALQKRLRELESQIASTPTPTPSADAPTAAAQPSADAASPADAAAASPDAAATPVQPASSETPPPRTRPRPTPTPSQPAAAQAPAPTPAPEPAPAPAWYENMYILGGLGALVLGLLGLVAMRRRRATADSAPASISSGRRYDSDAVLASMTANAAATAASEAEEASMDREAELLDAVAESPTDLSRHLELVQHYYAQSDAEAFEGSAEAMYAQLDDGEDMRWKQVLAMGQEFLPDHPLFSPPSPRAELPSQDEVHVDLHASDEPSTQRSSFESRPLSSPPAQAEELESLDFGSESDFASPAADDSQAEVPAEPQPQLERFGPAPVAEPDSGFLNDDDGDSFAGDDDSSATKLELARAYLDMGDVEGARAMLEEVASEGNPGQRSEAKRLLDEIR